VRLTSVHIQPEGEYLSLVTVGDPHVGGKTHNRGRFMAHQRYILASPDRLALGLGDDLENATKASVGSGVYEQTISPEEQLNVCAEWWSAVADRSLGILHCNHGARTVNASGLNPQAVLARFAGVPYLGYRAGFAFHVGPYIYTVYAIHGHGKAATAQGRRQFLERIKNKRQGLDVYLAGHFHTQDIMSFSCERYIQRKQRLAHHVQYGAIAGSFLDFEESYGEEAEYDYPIPGQVEIRMYKDERRVEVVGLPN
jgi:hypothetical protein